jgi:hypothetical protein
MSGQLQSIIPSPLPADLLEQLAQHQQTAGLAKLTQRLMAALKIPMHSRAGNDQSFGGVSDLSNRGNFDRLLLSELAHDDLSLMVRLANNEALYLRREELPSKHKRQRFILIDTSIKMWGTPRMYAIATALAAISNSKTIVHTFALQGSHYREISLSSITGIRTTLNQLSAALDSAEALTAFTKAFPLNRQQEYFLITDEQLFYTPSFQYAFANLRNAHGFLATVSRSGQLQLFQYTGGRRRLLHSILLDLPELLEAVLPSSALPAFLSLKTAPLYLPHSRTHLTTNNAFDEFGLAHITKEKQLLYWPNKTTGAREIIACLPEGNYSIGYENIFMIYILVYNKDSNRLWLYRIATGTLITETIECRHPFTVEDPIQFYFRDDVFTIFNRETVYSLDLATGILDNGRKRIPGGPVTSMLKQISPLYYYANIPGHINNGYSVFKNVKQIYIMHGTLRIGAREFYINGNELYLRKSKRLTDKFMSATGPEIVELPDVGYKLSRFVFPNGSEAFVDPRGFLHLRSSDKNQHEISIVLISGKSIACWSSDGHVCGSGYFTGDNPIKIPVQEFYNRYIQSFIHALS